MGNLAVKDCTFGDDIVVVHVEIFRCFGSNLLTDFGRIQIAVQVAIEKAHAVCRHCRQFELEVGALRYKVLDSTFQHAQRLWRLCLLTILDWLANLPIVCPGDIDPGAGNEKEKGEKRRY